MQNRLISRKRPEARQGNTLPAQGEKQQPVPRTPNERDESSDSQASQEPSAQRIGKQAQQDIERGLVDTDKGPALDNAYDKMRQGPGDPIRK